MNNTVDPKTLKKAKIASSCFMGLGQILFLKQYLRGALYALVEVVMICCFIFGTKKVIPANNEAENYMKGIPEFSEMAEYLQNKEYDDLKDLLQDREEDLKEFLTEKAPSRIADFKYKVVKASVEAQALAEANEEAVSEMVLDCSSDQDEVDSSVVEKLYDEKLLELWNERFADYDASDLTEKGFPASFDEYTLKNFQKAYPIFVEKEWKETFSNEDDYPFTVDFNEWEKLVKAGKQEKAFALISKSVDAFDTAQMDYEDIFSTIVSDEEEFFTDEVTADFQIASEDDIDALNDIVEKYNRKFAKAMSNVAVDEYNAAVDDFLDNYEWTDENGETHKGFNKSVEKAAVAEQKASEINAAKEDYNARRAEIEAKEVRTVVQDTEILIIPATVSVDEFDNYLEKFTDSPIGEEVYTADHKNEELALLEKEIEAKLNEIDRKYNFDVREKLLADNDIINAFDSNYDGCIECKNAARSGERTTKHTSAFYGSPMVSALSGLITLGIDQPTDVMNYKDHSINMMIDGIFALIFIGLFIVLYAMNIRSAETAAKKVIKNGRFPTMKESQDDMSQHSFATIGMAPSVIMIAVFSVIPLLFSALVAFTNYQSPDHIPPKNLVSWVGFENFVTMFSTGSGVAGGGQFFEAFANAAIWTFVWAVFATLTCFFCGFFYAVVLQDKRIKFPGFYRTIYILPYAIPTMLSLFVWANLLNGQMGPINHTLRLLGIIDAQGETPAMFRWLSDPWVAKFTLIFVNIWIGFPYSMILTTSSMTAISNSLYEAATIDGANKWHQFRSITFPLVMFQLKPILIMQFAGNINNFGAVFFLTGGGPNLPQTGLTTATSCGATDLLISWIYKLTMNTPMRYNLASVLSLLVFAVLVPFALYSFTRTKSFKEGEV